MDAGVGREWCHTYDLTRSMDVDRVRASRLVGGVQGTAPDDSSDLTEATQARVQVPLYPWTLVYRRAAFFMGNSFETSRSLCGTFFQDRLPFTPTADLKQAALLMDPLRLKKGWATQLAKGQGPRAAHQAGA